MDRLRSSVDEVWHSPQIKRTATIAGIVGAVLALVIETIFQSIVTDWWHAALLPWLGKSSEWPNGLVALLLLPVPLVVLLYAGRQRLLGEKAALRRQVDTHASTVIEGNARTLRARNEVLEAELSKMDNIVLLLSMATREVAEGKGGLDDLCVRLLQRAINALIQLYGGHISRGHVLVPDSTDDRWLVCYADVGVDEKSRERRHYIGPMDADAKRRGFRRGTAGEVFVSGKPQFEIVDQQTKKAKRPGSQYMDYRKDRLTVPYQSFVALPIQLGFGKDKKRPLGVLCLDSPHQDTFKEDPTLTSVAHIVRVFYYLLLLRGLGTVPMAALRDAGWSASAQTE